MKTIVTRICTVVVLACLALTATYAAQNRIYLADQSDWGNKQGFYLNFENHSETIPCRLSNTGLALAIGDGNGWRFCGAPGPWAFDRDYTVKVVIAPDHAELWVDGVRASQSAGGFAPLAGSCNIGVRPGWAADKADYFVYINAAKVTCGATTKSLAFTPLNTRPIQSVLVAEQTAQGTACAPTAQDTLTVEVSFRFLRYPDKLQDIAPIVDRYGQFIQGDWPGKVKTDVDMKKAWKVEQQKLQAWGQPKGYDVWGGNTQLGWKQKGTGFYTVAQQNGRWWLITPQGNPCIYRGICAAPAVNWEMTPVTGREYLFQWLPEKTGEHAWKMWRKDVWGGNDGIDYIAFHPINMQRKYGANWKKFADELLVKRVRAWGFSGLGKWCDKTPRNLPYYPVLGLPDVTRLVDHPDVFDPAVQEQFRAALAKQILPQKNDPAVVGWSLGNEYGELITPGEISTIMQKSAEVPAKRALIDQLRQESYQGDQAKLAAAWGVQDPYAATTATIPAADIETMRRYYEDRYYHLAYTTVKQLDPNHLYLGGWIVPGWWINEQDWYINARYCDVIGYDRYDAQFCNEWMMGLLKGANKPILCGEFSYPPTYNSERGFGCYSNSTAKDDADAGNLYQRWMKDAAANPYCVGTLWFLYRDQPITGRGGVGESLVLGEHFAFGLVDVTDNPKWDMITRMREANLAADRWRMGK